VQLTRPVVFFGRASFDRASRLSGGDVTCSACCSEHWMPACIPVTTLAMTAMRRSATVGQEYTAVHIHYMYVIHVLRLARCARTIDFILILQERSAHSMATSCRLPVVTDDIHSGTMGTDRTENYVRNWRLGLHLNHSYELRSEIMSAAFRFAARTILLTVRLHPPVMPAPFESAHRGQGQIKVVR
jgi:hypothetical protein